jgi:hypothetical protein
MRDSSMGTEYVIVHSEGKSAKILQDNKERGMLKKTDSHGIFDLESKGEATQKENWKLTSKVDGEVRPFSIVCYKVGSKGHEELDLKIKDHIFSHGNDFYSIGEAVPVGASPRDSISGSKFICRLVNFPFSKIEDVDWETKHRMKRHRGIPVGEIHGLGADGYHVKIYGNELSDIGLPLAASTYLLYTTR